MYIVEAQVKRASEEDESVGCVGGEEQEWRSGGVWKRWGGTYCESEWHEVRKPKCSKRHYRIFRG